MSNNVLGFIPKNSPSGPLMTVYALNYAHREDMTAQELERFADEVRAQARKLRSASDKYARQNRDPWS